jgi:hypothetical protein
VRSPPASRTAARGAGNQGKPRAIKLRRLAEAWAREAQQELQLVEEDVAPLVARAKNALHREIERTKNGLTKNGLGRGIERKSRRKPS